MPDELETRLSQIHTCWTLVQRAHGESVNAATSARHELMQRYMGAAYRYLFAIVKDPDAADELFQEFALRFVRGDFHKADPGKGQFRKYVKSALINLALAYRKKGRPRGPALHDIQLEPQVHDSESERADREFIASWRDELLARTWSALEAHEGEHGQPFHTVLRYRSEHTDASAEQMAADVSASLRRDPPWTAAAMRKLLQRSRQRFAELLLEEVIRSLENAPPDHIEQELADLELLPFCRPALDAWRKLDSE